MLTAKEFTMTDSKNPISYEWIYRNFINSDWCEKTMRKEIRGLVMASIHLWLEEHEVKATKASYVYRIWRSGYEWKQIISYLEGNGIR